MTERREIVMAHLKRDGIGLEIGPSHAPIAAKKDGFRVHVLDHLAKEGLVEKYRTHPGVNIDNIEEVDFVWDGRPYAELIGRNAAYDWIIASHIIEHSPDLIGFLNDCDSILKPDGALSLVVPDKRYCFDHFRPLTGLARVVDASSAKIHSSGTAAEYFLNVVTKGGQIAWHSTHPGEFIFCHSLEQARQAIRDIREHGAYLDMHAWCFTPTSFRLMMRDLYQLGLIQLKEVAVHPPIGCEFYVTLSRTGKVPEEPRLELVNRILQEEAAAA